MLEIIFNEISAAELAALPRTLQLELLSEFQLLPTDLAEREAPSHFGRIEREGKRLSRFRASDYRIYFETRPEGVIVHRILHRNTIRDFLFRSGLPMTDEDEVRHVKAFWELIEEGNRGAKP